MYNGTSISDLCIFFGKRKLFYSWIWSLLKISDTFCLDFQNVPWPQAGLWLSGGGFCSRAGAPGRGFQSQCPQGWPWANVWDAADTPQWPGPRAEAGTLPGRSCRMRTETQRHLQPHFSTGKESLQKPFVSSGKAGVERPQDSNAYSLLLKQNSHPHCTPSMWKVFYALGKPLLRSVTAQSPIWQWKCARAQASGVAVSTRQKVQQRLKPLIYHCWGNWRKSTKILVNHCPESWNLSMNSCPASYPKQKFFLYRCQIINAWPFPRTEI